MGTAAPKDTNRVNVVPLNMGAAAATASYINDVVVEDVAEDRVVALRMADSKRDATARARELPSRASLATRASNESTISAATKWPISCSVRLACDT